MPKLDKTGPLGEGSNSGRGLGNCDSNNDEKEKTLEEKPNNKNIIKKPLYGRGIGLGRRSGRGFRNRGR